jgi:hypothetical protein
VGSSGRERTARRWLGVVLATVATIVVVIVVVRPTANVEGSAASTLSPRLPATTTPPPTSPPPADERPPEMPPAWLAWIAGSLPESFARAAAREPALGTTVVVAGDTRWMTETRDDDGHLVDRPRPPFRVPVDAFAVSPGAYAPFLPEEVRADLTAVLREGDAIIGESSAALRRIGPGGTMSFGPVDVAVGAVVPDDQVGWAEMLVPRDVGARLGIVHERYLLALPDRPMTERRFAGTMSRLLPGTDVKTVPPGTTPFVRIASGVNPPVVTKTIFGEFSAYPQPGNEAFLTIDPAWVHANIRSRAVPLLGRVTCHRLLLGPLTTAMEEVRSEGLGSLIHVYSGCWAARTVQRSPTAPPSQHAYGAAIDINAPQSPFGAPPNFDPRVVAILESYGFNWGGDFLIPDGHHFEWWGDRPLPGDA